MLELVPVTLKEANAFVEQHHRHHKPVVGHKFSVAAAMDGRIVGVAIVGRPVSRYLDDGWTLEVIQELMGHVKPETTQRYIAKSQARVVQSAARYFNAA